MEKLLQSFRQFSCSALTAGQITSDQDRSEDSAFNASKSQSHLGHSARRLSTKAAVLAAVSVLSSIVETARANDLLNGAGLFNGTSIEEWIQVEEDVYTIAVQSDEDGKPYLEMTKSAEAKGFYDDGLAYVFKDDQGNLKSVKPAHIHIEVQSGSGDLETCDLRLYSVEVSDETKEEKESVTVCSNSEWATGGGPNIEGAGANPERDPASPPRPLDNRRRLQDTDEKSGEAEAEEAPEEGEEDGEQESDAGAESQDGEELDCEKGTVTVAKAPSGFGNYTKTKYSDVAFLRLGFFKHLKLNTESMIKMFEEGEWLSVDLLIDWEEQTVSIYVDGEAKLATPFFTKRKQTIQEINTVALYGLTPESVSRFRNLQICDDICTGVEQPESELKIIDGSLVGLGVQLVTLLGVLLATLV